MPMFRETTDYLVFRSSLLQAIQRFECDIYAYVFMTNHVHFLMSSSIERGISLLMKNVGSQYARYFNDRYVRTGGLFEGRYRATVIDSEAYLFTCSRYIEENPVRAGMVSERSDYRWSSYGCNAFGAEDPLVTPHERYVALGASPEQRQMAYRHLFANPDDAAAFDAIRRATNHSWALGSEEFLKNTIGLVRPPPPHVRGHTGGNPRGLTPGLTPNLGGYFRLSASRPAGNL